MESVLNLLRGWRLGEAILTAIVAIQLFCVNHKLLMFVVCLVLLAALVLWICLRRAKPPRELVEGGVCSCTQLFIEETSQQLLNVVCDLI